MESKFKVGDRVVWDDIEYANKYYPKSLHEIMKIVDADEHGLLYMSNSVFHSINRKLRGMSKEEQKAAQAVNGLLSSLKAVEENFVKYAAGV